MREDIRQIEEIERGRQHRARQQAAVQRFNEVITQCLAYQKQADAGTVEMTTLTQWSAGLTPLIAELNAETEVEIAKARDFLASELRDLSISIWNNNQRNGHAALAVLAQGLTLHIQATTRTSLQADQERLRQLMKVHDRPEPSLFPPPVTARPQPKSASVLPAWFWMGAIGLVLFLVVIAVQYNKQLGPGSTTSVPDPTASVYFSNQLPTGASPLDNCFGKGKYGGPCWVQFNNSANSTDAIICLVNTRTGRTIRNEYIRAGGTFKMTQVPRGSYYVKGCYGRDWNPSRRNTCGTKGCFDSYQSFSASPGEAFKLINNAKGYSTHTISLYGVAADSSQQLISTEQFFQITSPL